MKIGKWSQISKDNFPEPKFYRFEAKIWSVRVNDELVERVGLHTVSTKALASITLYKVQALLEL